MDGQHGQNPTTTQGAIEQLKRRGLMAGLAALVVGGLTRVTARPAAADTGDDLVLGKVNTVQTSTTEIETDGGGPGNQGFRVYNGSGGNAFTGIANGSGNGCYGKSPDGEGVLGESKNGPGVRGKCYGTSPQTKGYGVMGETAAAGFAGVMGLAATGSDGVQGFGQGEANAGVHGIGFTGVLGESQIGSGVRGKSDKGSGLFGFSASGHGLDAESTAYVAALVFSEKNTALYAQTAQAGGDAGQFFGNVFIQGSYTATGIKSAAVPFPDGTRRRLYCQESPDCWFEDFNEATLVKGRAEVRIDPDFAQTVDLTKTYHVFVTPHDSKNAGLAVVARLLDRFVVEERGGGDGTFSYRLVARRKDIAAPRFERVEVPLPIPRPARPR